MYPRAETLRMGFAKRQPGDACPQPSGACLEGAVVVPVRAGQTRKRLAVQNVRSDIAVTVVLVAAGMRAARGAAHRARLRCVCWPGGLADGRQVCEGLPLEACPEQGLRVAVATLVNQL